MKLQLVVILLAILMRHWRTLRVCPGIILSIVDLAIGCLPLVLSGGFCGFQFLTARDPSRRVPDVVGHGLDRDMLRTPSRGVELTRGHTRSVSGDERKRLQKLRKHMHKWDNDSEYRLQRSRLGMVRDRYDTNVVRPWMAINADGTPPVLPEPPLPLGIPAVATVIA